MSKKRKIWQGFMLHNFFLHHSFGHTPHPTLQKITNKQTTKQKLGEWHHVVLYLIILLLWLLTFHHYFVINAVLMQHTWKLWNTSEMNNNQFMRFGCCIYQQHVSARPPCLTVHLFTQYSIEKGALYWSQIIWMTVKIPWMTEENWPPILAQ